MTTQVKAAAHPADVNHKVRANRAYLAGFGTSGSLLVGAALIFVLASAIVAFHGWPEVAAQPPTVNVLSSRVKAAPGSKATRILAAAVTPRGGVAAGIPGRVASAHRAGGTGGTRGVISGGGSRPAPNGSSGTVVPPKQCTTCTSPTVPSGPGGATGTLGQTISQIGAGTGSLITQTSSSAANSLKGTNSSAASAVKHTGAALGGTVTSVTGAVGSAVGHPGHRGVLGVR